MQMKLTVDFSTIEEMLQFANNMQSGAAGVALNTVLQRIDTMANQEVASILADMRTGFERLDAAQARVYAVLQDIPNRIQAAVDAALASGVSPEQIVELTALRDRVAAEADELAAAVPTASPTPPTPSPVPPPAPQQPTTVTVPPVVTNPASLP